MTPHQDEAGILALLLSEARETSEGSFSANLSLAAGASGRAEAAGLHYFRMFAKCGISC